VNVKQAAEDASDPVRSEGPSTLDLKVYYESESSAIERVAVEFKSRAAKDSTAVPGSPQLRSVNNEEDR
jgi:hypothetical protein